MDFKWDNNQGPVGHDSPFVQGAAQGWKSNTFAGFKRKRMVFAFVNQEHDTNAQCFQGPARELDSPTKPALPALHDPENQTHLFSATPSNRPVRNLSFTTPQGSIETDFSSGPDMSSPANADNEATPDPPARSVVSHASRAMVQFKSDTGTSSGGLYDKALRSGRGEITRKHFPDGAHRRVSKRRRRDVDKDVQLAPRLSSNDSDFEERPSSSECSQQNGPSVRPMGFVPSVLTFIDAHPSLPNTLSFYVQFLLNCFFAFCMMYVLYGFYSTICHDIEERAMMESSDILAEMAACAHEFKENRCDRDSRVPAMETVCNNWEKCMQRDPLKVGRSRLSAGMFAEIFNGFIEPISLKAIVRSCSCLIRYLDQRG